MLEFFRDGGPFMWPLGLWSIMALAFFLERVFTYARMRSESELAGVTNDITSRIDSGTSFEQLREYCGELGKLEGEVFAEGIERFEHLSREQRLLYLEPPDRARAVDVHLAEGGLCALERASWKSLFEKAHIPQLDALV